MTPAEARARFSAARVARLATIRPAGAPHLVPVTFAVEGDRIYTAVDAKPKRHDRLVRLDNIQAHPRVCLLVDHWSEDWSDLWWARADGAAHVSPADSHAVALLRERYEQYQRQPPRGPVVIVDVERWTGWTARPPGT